MHVLDKLLNGITNALVDQSEFFVCVAFAIIIISLILLLLWFVGDLINYEHRRSKLEFSINNIDGILLCIGGGVIAVLWWFQTKTMLDLT